MFDYCIYFNTTALARLLEREWTKAFIPFGLTPAQAFMLRAVLEKPGLLQKQLAHELMISRSTATRTLDGLQKKGLVVRKTTETDGRELALYPTAKGSAFQEQLIAASKDVTKRLKQELGMHAFDDIVGQAKKICSLLK